MIQIKTRVINKSETVAKIYGYCIVSICCTKFPSFIYFRLFLMLVYFLEYRHGMYMF